MIHTIPVVVIPSEPRLGTRGRDEDDVEVTAVRVCDIDGELDRLYAIEAPGDGGRGLGPIRAV